ncbi:transcriptional regulator [Mesorhizobium plurifarium]|uniref:transposase n=1 Tax=Sinorhizobium arboris TaxID=76745 RepID=UPI00041F6AB0|nr:transposase [Sinorhizobium arboris]PST20654.1 transcriptional regulator [Mesorhizobium plurifarium]
MAEEHDVQLDTTSAETEPKKAKPRAAARQKKKTTTASARAVPNTSNAGAQAPKARKYTEAERAEKLSLIKGLLSAGKSTLKDALKQVGITEQTYYNWRKAAEPVSQADDLKDLVELEKENKRLRKLLADRLRAENAELRKRLGMDR